MPPVRWKIWYCVTTIFVQVIIEVAAQQMQDSISMSSDGWRPIVGSRRQKPSSQTGSEIRQYANPSQDFDVVPADVVNVETTTLPFGQQSTAQFRTAAKNGGNFKDRKPVVGKLKQTYKTVSPYYMVSGQGQSGNQQLKKLQAIKKPLLVQNKPRKPIRGQMVSHSTRNEIFVPPPLPNTGPGGYSFVKSVLPNNIKTREAQGFGLLNSNFGQSQQNAHIELGRFPIAGESSSLQRPTFFFAKPLQNDEYSRNLVPPPRARGQQKGKQDTKISLYAFKEGPATDASANIPQFGARPNQFLPQVVPTYEFSSQSKPQTLKEQAVDVQVTKENLKQYTPSGAPSPVTFGPIPGRNSFPIGYVDYNFQKASPSNSPSPLTYEVTEGKWIDTPSQQYQFRPQDGFFQYQNIRQSPTNARPGLLFQSEGSTSRPPVFQAPLVDLSVPAFLPTPYKAEGGVIPTSPTQSEAATVFAQVSNKMNKYRTNVVQENPLFFDIKDVSTHYPILGNPDTQSERGTDYPLEENGEISNEISTTQKERVRRPTKQPVTQSTSTRDPTKSRITNRRKPRPRKPSTTTTSTEEPIAETYEPLKSSENVEPPIEVERPLRRRRPKPTVYRQQEVDVQVEQQPNQNQMGAEGEPANRQRGRYRQRNRSSTESTQRRRPKPTHENVMKQKNFFEEISETPLEQERFSIDKDASFDSGQNYYSQEASQSNENGQMFETEVPVREYESVQEQPIRQENKPFIEEIHAVTGSTRAPELEPSTRYHLPENEVDFTTSPQPIPDVEEFTSTPTTTLQPLTTLEVSTVKSTRIRRPSKYDNSNRPRFSVKEYRQRLNQHTSTTPSSTTTQARTGSDNLRLRFPSRLRTRPSPTTASSRVDEDITDETTTTTMKSRFRPKEPRHDTTTTELNGIITERTIKAVNTRLRPFGRTKPMVETTTSAPKVSIRPNLFSARRRAGYPSLKNRIQNKNKKNDTDEENLIETTTRVESEVEGVDPLSAAESATTALSTTTSDELDSGVSEDASTEFAIEQSITEDILKNDDYAQSQRVSDLTSSFMDYGKPGVFNSVGPTSRSIPNYFTIATDDPILPIEAFFPSLKEKHKMR